MNTILSFSAAENLIHAFCFSKLNYCNSLLSGCSNNSLKKPPADPKCCSQSSDRTHISPILASALGLPVKSKIKFKILPLTYKALNDRAPSYLKDLIVTTSSQKSTWLWECRLTSASKKSFQKQNEGRKKRKGELSKSEGVICWIRSKKVAREVPGPLI